MSHRRGWSIEQDWINGIERRIEVKCHLFIQGDARTHLYEIASGAICLYTMLADGRRQVIDFAFAGDLIGLGSADAEACNAQAIVSTEVKFLPLSVLLSAAARDTKVALTLYEALSRELTAAREHLQCIGQRGATERLAMFFVVLARKNAARGCDPTTFELPMTRADIADFLGLKLETVSRTLSKLKRQGLIEIEQSKTIRLTDPRALARLARGDVRV